MIELVAVDDSPLIREFVSSALEDDPDIRLVAMGNNGADAIDIVRRVKPSVLLLDLEMPGIDGLDVLRTLMAECPLRVLVYTSHKGKSLSAYQALRLGALGYLRKPEGVTDPEGLAKAKSDLIEHVKTVASAGLTVFPRDPTVAPRVQPPEDCPFGAVAVACTSGNATALLSLLRGLPLTMPVPVVVFPQVNSAMVPGFADWINSQVGIRVSPVADQVPAGAGTVHLSAPGCGFQIRGGLWCSVPERASDPTTGGLDASLTHLVEAYSGRLLVVILSGFGVDGLEGLQAVRKKGGTVVVLEAGADAPQDLRAAANRHNLVSETVPLVRLGTRILELCAIRRV